MSAPTTTYLAPLANTTVRKAMRPGVVVCLPESPPSMIAALMSRHAIHAVVLPYGAGGAFAITDLDLIRAALHNGARTAVEIATEPMATVGPDATMMRAVATMADRDAAHLLVTDERRRPLGVVSSFDVASLLAGWAPDRARRIRPAPARPMVRSPLRRATVRDAMHPGVASCRPETSLSELAAVMAEHRVHCVAVTGVAGTSAGDGGHLLWGLVDDMDIVSAVHGENRDVRAADLAATKPAALPQDVRLERAAALMAEHGVRHVVAVGRSGLATGMVSTLDVIRVLGST
jgi:CBS domain-containing protein